MTNRAIIVSETWQPITKWPGFEVSNHGRVKRLAYLRSDGRKQQERIITSRVADNRYVCIFPYGGTQRIVVNLARTVLEAFVGPEPFPGADARHLDDNSYNMMLDNLAWGTHAENMQDAVRNGFAIGRYVRTEKTKQRNSLSKQGNTLTEEHKAKIADGVNRAVKEGRKNYQHSEEAKRKISEAKKLYWEGLRNG